MEKQSEYESKVLRFDLETGLSPDHVSTKRKLSDMKGMYYESQEYDKLLQIEDTLIYEYYNLPVAEKASDLAYGTTILYPGKVGKEYFMTKGHFHSILETAEVYYCTKGLGYMLMENPEGMVEVREMKPGVSVYVPSRYAHRSINISKNKPLITFFVYRADAGHDYGTIEKKGFRKLVIEENNNPKIIDNPKWNF